MEVNTAITNEDQLKVVKKLEEVLNILRHTQIKNKESLQYIEKPLDDLLSSLKYLPTDPPFSFLPTEIKTDILGYLCNSGALVAASVCQEWKQILSPQMNKAGVVKIGKHCSNEHECKDGKCFKPQSMLKALTTLELNAPLSVCHPLTGVDPQVVGEGLASASSLSIIGDCTECVGEADEYYEREPILTSEQEQQLLVALENRSEIMEEVELRATELNNVDQDRLISFLVTNNRLNLNEGDGGPILAIKKLVEKLKNTTGFRLVGLYLDEVQYSDDLAEDMADALCKVPVVTLDRHFPLTTETLERLFENILTRPVRIFSLSLYGDIDWRFFIDPDNLKNMINKMVAVELEGTFSPEQLEAARSCPGVTISSDNDVISKVPVFHL